MTYFSWAALSSCTTRSYFLLVFSTLFLTRVALPVLGTDSMKASHSWIFLVFSGSIRRTSLVMFCRRNKAFRAAEPGPGVYKGDTLGCPGRGRRSGLRICVGWKVPFSPAGHGRIFLADFLLTCPSLARKLQLGSGSSSSSSVRDMLDSSGLLGSDR